MTTTDQRAWWSINVWHVWRPFENLLTTHNKQRCYEEEVTCVCTECPAYSTGWDQLNQRVAMCLNARLLIIVDDTLALKKNCVYIQSRWLSSNRQPFARIEDCTFKGWERMGVYVVLCRASKGSSLHIFSQTAPKPERHMRRLLAFPSPCWCRKGKH